MAAIRAHSASDPEREVCGLLLGSGGRVDQAVATLNVAKDPARRFEIDAAELFVAIRNERAGGTGLLGYYHSHPDGVAEPSALDRELAAGDGRLWLIVADDAITGWQATVNGFEAIEIVVTPLAPGESVGH